MSGYGLAAAAAAAADLRRAVDVHLVVALEVVQIVHEQGGGDEGAEREEADEPRRAPRRALHQYHDPHNQACGFDARPDSAERTVVRRERPDR